MTREKRPVRAQHGEIGAGVAPHRGIEPLQFLPRNRNLYHTGEFRRRAAAADREERRRRRHGDDLRRRHLADEDADILRDMRGEIIVAAEGAVTRDRILVAGDKRHSGGVEHPDRVDLRQRVRGLLQLDVEGVFVVADVLVRKRRGELIGLQEHQINRLEDLLRVLMENVERSFDPLFGGRIGRAVVQPGRVAEQNCRQDDGPRHHDEKKPDRRAFGVLHASLPAWQLSLHNGPLGGEAQPLSLCADHGIVHSEESSLYGLS